MILTDGQISTLRTYPFKETISIQCDQAFNSDACPLIMHTQTSN